MFLKKNIEQESIFIANLILFEFLLFKVRCHNVPFSFCRGLISVSVKHKLLKDIYTSVNYVDCTMRITGFIIVSQTFFVDNIRKEWPLKYQLS